MNPKTRVDLKEKIQLRSEELNKLSEHIEDLIKACNLGIIKEPQGFIFAKCPECNARLHDDYTLQDYANYSYSVRYKVCPRCPYEWAKRAVGYPTPYPFI